MEGLGKIRKRGYAVFEVRYCTAGRTKGLIRFSLRITFQVNLESREILSPSRKIPAHRIDVNSAAEASTDCACSTHTLQSTGCYFVRKLETVFHPAQAISPQFKSEIQQSYWSRVSIPG